MRDLLLEFLDCLVNLWIMVQATNFKICVGIGRGGFYQKYEN